MSLRPIHNKLFIRPTLLRRLIRKFGKEDTRRQLKWIQRDWVVPHDDGTKTRPSLTGLLYRLLRDEPLAYVLGEYGMLFFEDMELN
jgi:hypothetical protein